MGHLCTVYLKGVKLNDYTHCAHNWCYILPTIFHHRPRSVSYHIFNVVIQTPCTYRQTHTQKHTFKIFFRQLYLSCVLQCPAEPILTNSHRTPIRHRWTVKWQTSAASFHCRRSNQTAEKHKGHPRDRKETEHETFHYKTSGVLSGRGELRGFQGSRTDFT